MAKSYAEVFHSKCRFARLLEPSPEKSAYRNVAFRPIPSFREPYFSGLGGLTLQNELFDSFKEVPRGILRVTIIPEIII